MSVYDRIDSILKEKKISRRTLAALAGINHNTMSSLFARKPEPIPPKYLNPIVKALNISPAELNGITLLKFPQIKESPVEGAAFDIIEVSTQDTPKLSDILAMIETLDTTTLEIVSKYASHLAQTRK